MTPAELAVLATRLEAIHEDIRDLKDYAQKTSSRVGTLEAKQAVQESVLATLVKAGRAGLEFRRAILVAVAAAMCGALLTALVAHAL